MKRFTHRNACYLPIHIMFSSFWSSVFTCSYFSSQTNGESLVASLLVFLRPVRVHWRLTLTAEICLVFLNPQLSVIPIMWHALGIRDYETMVQVDTKENNQQKARLKYSPFCLDITSSNHNNGKLWVQDPWPCSLGSKDHLTVLPADQSGATLQ